MNTYANYFYLNFKSFTSKNGDCYDRYNLRMIEMVESLNIINILLKKILKKKNLHQKTYFNSNKDRVYQNMESLIKHFKYWSSGFNITANTIATYIESPKGEFGVIIQSDNTNNPYRIKIRSPGYFNLQALATLAKGHLIADLVTLVGTIDIVFGEIDR